MPFELPSELPVMTLPNIVLFPQALLPLHIFEPRYRRMLRDVLDTDRLFAVAKLDLSGPPQPDPSEPLHRIGTVGIVRACQKNPNGTSDILLQGLCRVEILSITREIPYRRIEVSPLFSTAGGSAAELEELRRLTLGFLSEKRSLGLPLPEELARLIEPVEDPDAFADLSAFGLCEEPALKQRLLETLTTRERLHLIARNLGRELRTARLQRELQGGLPDEDIHRN